jgi:hypothetical protein
MGKRQSQQIALTNSVIAESSGHTAAAGIGRIRNIDTIDTRKNIVIEILFIFPLS